MPLPLGWCVGVGCWSVGRDPNRQLRTIGLAIHFSVLARRLWAVTSSCFMVRRTVAVGVRLTVADRALACALPRSLTYRRPARPLFRIRSRAPTCCRLPLLDK